MRNSIYPLVRSWPFALVALMLLALSARGEEGVLGWFSLELRKVQREFVAKRSSLAALGEQVVGPTAPQLGFQHLQLVAPPPESPWIQLDLGSSQQIDTIALIPAVVDFQPIARGAYGFPRRFRVDVSDDRTFETFTPIFVHTDTDFRSPGVAPVVIAANGRAARYIRLTVTRLAEQDGVFFFALAEMMVLQGNRNIALLASASGSNSAHLPPRWSLQYLVDGRTPFGPPIRRSALPKFDAFFAKSTPDGEPAWLGLDLGRTVEVEEIRLHPLHARQGADVPGFAFPLQFRVELSSDAAFTGVVQVFDTGSSESADLDFQNPGNNPVTLPAGGKQGRFVRIVMQKSSRGRDLSMALSELEVYSDGINVARGSRPMSSGDPGRSPPRPGELLVDGHTSFGELMELPVWLADLAQRSRLQAEMEQLGARLPELESLAKRRAAWSAGVTGSGAALAGVAIVLRGRRRRFEELERFRERLAQDLHDEIGSNLAAIARVSEMAAAEGDKTSDEWREVHQISRETTDAMREVLWMVGARNEQGIDLMEHLQLTAARLLPGRTVRWVNVADHFPEEWPMDARRQVFLFFKETLANIARHSRAAQVELSARIEAGAFELMIRDDGCGFIESETRAGLGLRGLRERARSLRGSVTIDSTPGTGTCVTLRVPLAAL